MAKKFGKFLLITAAVGGAAAAVYYFIRKKDADSDILDDEDYDDFSEDLDEDAETTTNYVPLTPEDTSSESPAEDSFVPLDQVAPSADKAETDEDGKSDVEVEEFFDEDDETEEEPPLSDN